MSVKIVITGGGSGGHAYPALSIAETLQRECPGCQLLYIGSKDGPEERLAILAGIRFIGLASRKLRKVLSVDGMVTGGFFVRGLLEASVELKRFRADVVVGTGGYAAASVVLAQAMRRGRTVIVEPDVIPGRTNKWLGRYASTICLAFGDAARYFPSGRTVVTGLPIRSILESLPEKAEARISLGLDPALFTVLVVGGSQGARRLNEIIGSALPALSGLPIQIIHQVGMQNAKAAERVAEESGWPGYHVHGYLYDMVSAYGSADMIICRSGSSTIAEVTAVGLPAVMVPYPYAHADHQRFNAESVARNGAGIVINESDLSPDKVVEVVRQFLESPDMLQRMAEASKALGRPDAASAVARIVLGDKS